MFNSVFDAIFWIAVASCALAQLAIVRSVLRMRRVGAQPTPDTSYSPSPVAARSRSAIEIAWVVLPAIALLTVLAFTWRSMRAREDAQVTPPMEHVHGAVTRSGD